MPRQVSLSDKSVCMSAISHAQYLLQPHTVHELIFTCICMILVLLIITLLFFHSRQTFFVRQRLKPQFDLLERDYGDRGARDLWPLVERNIPKIFDQVEIFPALLHGDLNQGNVGQDNSEPGNIFLKKRKCQKFCLIFRFDTILMWLV